MNFTDVKFIKSAAAEKDFIRDAFPQITFAGRSNVGKSSLINSLVKKKNFARVGASPGKTAHINYFVIEKKAYLTDLIRADMESSAPKKKKTTKKTKE